MLAFILAFSVWTVHINYFYLLESFRGRVMAIPLVITPLKINDHNNILGKEHWRAVDTIKHC